MNQLYAIYERHVKFRDINRVKLKGWKKTCYAKRNQKWAEVAILLLGKY